MDLAASPPLPASSPSALAASAGPAPGVAGAPRRLLAALGPGRVWIMGAVAAVMLGAMAMIALSGRDGDMAYLYTDLDPAAARSITDKLSAANTPFQLSADGTGVMVPRARVAELRMSLAGEQLGGAIGYEILDQQTGFGQSAARERLDATRALEGELARSIATLQPVQSARVHVVLAERALFATTARPASAAVTLRTRGALSAENVAAIRNLVAGAVPELSADAVSVIDQRGRLLARAGSAGAASGELDGRQAEIEARLRSEVEALLSPIVGSGKVRAQVSAELDPDQRREEARRFDPDGQVIARQISVEAGDQSQASDGAAGAVSASEQMPGEAGATGGAAPAGAGSRSASNETSEDVTYDNSRTDTVTTRAPGTIRRLSVAVMIDGGKKGLPPAQLQRLQRLVENAVGFNEERGDTVAVEAMAFTAEAAGADAPTDWLAMIPTGLLFDLAKLAMVAGAGLFVLRLIRSADGAGGAAATVDGGTLANGGEGAAMLPGAAGGGAATTAPGASSAMLQFDSDLAASQADGDVKAASLARISDAIRANPSESTSVIRKWISQ